MIKYQIRSRDLIGVYQEIKSGRLIPDAYFQRNLVWRDSHKQDFIKTILLGFPFPQIFISKGKIDVAAMQTTSCIVDGQQRMNAIREFIEGDLRVDNRTYDDLTDTEKSEFLKYEIAVIELDIENTDQKIKEIFQRINRTANALTAIEKLASEYAASEFMFTCRVLADDIELDTSVEDEYRIDPVITADLLDWAKSIKVTRIKKLLIEGGVFSSHEITRKVHLQYLLNIAATVLGGYYNRNAKVIDFLNDYAVEFPNKEQLVKLLEKTAGVFDKLKLPKKSIWRNKANFFSLFVELYFFNSGSKSLDIEATKQKLTRFETRQPEDFKLAGQEAVNNKQQRETRGQYVRKLLVEID
ncbi:MAG TPA: DUF262 domain-containing protein [Candidatus Paceibacterota bacterium]